MPQQPRVKTQDPAQVKLRQKKREWNTQYKSLSTKLKAFKDALNGRGSSKIGIPNSNIKDPLPPEVGSVLNQLSGEFGKLISDAEAVIHAQEDYSNTRRKKQPKKPQQPNLAPVVAPPQDDKVVDVLSRLGQAPEAEIEKNASRISRFWQYMTAMFSRREFTAHRVGLLKQTAALYYSVLDFENSILSLSVKNIPESVSTYKTIEYNADALQQTMDVVIEMLAAKTHAVMPDTKQSIPGKTDRIDNEVLETNQPAIEQSKQNVNEVNIMNGIEISVNSVIMAGDDKNDTAAAMKDMIENYKQEDDPHLKSMQREMIIKRYKALKNSWFGKKSNKPKEASEEQDEIIKISHNFLSRYLKKQLVKSVPFNRSASVRLQIVNIVQVIKGKLKELMKALEKGVSPNITQLLQEIKAQFEKIRRPMSVLSIFYKEKYLATHKRKMVDISQEPEDPFLQNSLRRHIRRDFWKGVL